MRIIDRFCGIARQNQSGGRPRLVFEIFVVDGIVVVVVFFTDIVVVVVVAIGFTDLVLGIVWQLDDIQGLYGAFAFPHVPYNNETDHTV
jgi:hypothetical protein